MSLVATESYRSTVYAELEREFRNAGFVRTGPNLWTRYEDDPVLTWHFVRIRPDGTVSLRAAPGGRCVVSPYTALEMARNGEI